MINFSLIFCIVVFLLTTILFEQTTSESCNWGYVGGVILPANDCIIPYSSYNDDEFARSWNVFCNYTDPNDLSTGQAWASFWDNTTECENEPYHTFKLDYFYCESTSNECESFELIAYIHDKGPNNTNNNNNNNNYNCTSTSNQNNIGHFLDTRLYQEYSGCYNDLPNNTFIQSATYEFNENIFKWILFNNSNCQDNSVIYNYTFVEGCHYMKEYNSYVLTVLDGYSSTGGNSNGNGNGNGNPPTSNANKITIFGNRLYFGLIILVVLF